MSVLLLTFAVAIVKITFSESQVYVYPYGSKLILVEPNEDSSKVNSRRCFLYDENDVENYITEGDIEEDIIKLLKCDNGDVKSRRKRTTDKILKTLTIFPGTNWCGAGNKSEDNDELGKFDESDNCCKQHDECFDVIGANQTKYGLKNSGLTTLSHCDCDDAFYRCLKEVDSPVSFSIGNLFFNVLRMKCFRKDYPIIGCKKEIDIIKRCEEYDFDEGKSKEWQMFDPKKY
uniref:Phospholipase A2 n=1 Tax=Androctonus crassicauda TaxID=122909 RepID=A0AA49XAC4_ANDCR|nr:secretory phospholipase A2 isoform X3 [Androctonus crassicauda]